MFVFKHLEDKDLFQKLYSQMLANRLVSHMSASDEAESSMIGKLQHVCGDEYTSKLQRMYQVWKSRIFFLERKSEGTDYEQKGLSAFFLAEFIRSKRKSRRKIINLRVLGVN